MLRILDIVDLKISKGGIFYTPQIDTMKCSPTGGGVSRINISNENIYVNDEYVYGKRGTQILKFA